MKKRKIFIFLSLFILFISTILTLKIKISFQKYVDSYFIISALLTSIFLFKLLLEKGVFNVFGYSWYKSKQYILFFLPRYRFENNKDITFDDYLKDKEKKNWKNLSTLITASLFHLVISSILSLLIFFTN